MSRGDRGSPSTTSKGDYTERFLFGRGKEPPCSTRWTPRWRRVGTSFNDIATQMDVGPRLAGQASSPRGLNHADPYWKRTAGSGRSFPPGCSHPPLRRAGKRDNASDLGGAGELRREGE